uniref:Putative 26s proteasome regulatory complex subunit psmd10 n=1 Tax=Culex tarsalis TaxID=7177 RepID=A0A1Q3FZN3_CULTA
MEEFSFGLFDDLLEGELHPLQIDDYEDEEGYKRQLKEKKLNVYAPLAGDTKLHRAIRGGNQIEINTLLELYREDFDKVRDHLVAKYQCNTEDKIWLRKTVLVASTEEQCQNAKNLENRQVDADELRRAVFVLLKYPTNGEDVAVLHPNEANRSAVVKLITTLIPNGFLTWNYVGTEGIRGTFMEAAVTKGMHSVIDRMYELGAPIAIPGHNPLLIAIRNNRKETVKWLLTKHFDNFDCTLRGASEYNALVAAIQRNDGALFDIVLEKMIEYRQKYFNETAEEAFHDIFRLEHEDYSYTTIFSFVKQSGPVFERVDKAIEKYKLKLSYQWKHNVALGRLIQHKIALNYCFKGIRNDPQLLGLKEHESTTVLHKLVRSEHLGFVCEMYTKHPETKSFFNADGAFDLLNKAISDRNREIILFMLEHHEQFLKSDMDKLRDRVVCCQYYTKEFYEARRDLLVECFPELRESIKEMEMWVQTNKHYYGIEGSFAKVNINVSDFDQLPKPYSTVRGSNGETLLHWAVDKDDKQLIIRLLELGCELDALDNDGNHPVHLVKSEEMLDLIIERHPEGRTIIQRTNNDGCTVLHKICQQRMDHTPLINLLEKVIEYGADVHQLTKHGESAVFFVGSCRLLDVLRKHKVKLDVVNNNGETALERHLSSGNVCMARPLFSYVHDLPSFKEHAHKYLEPMLNQYGHVYTYDYRVIFEKYPKEAKIMLDSVYEHSREEACRLFSKACETGFVYVVERFLDGNYDLDFNYRDRYESTPILGLLNHMDQINSRVLKRLLEKNVDLRARCQWGRDALMYLIWRYRSAKWNGLGLETVQLLLDHGASINTTDEDGNTPLHLAFQQREMELVEFLLQNGANSRAVNGEGKRPFEMAPTLERELFYFYSDEFILN